MFDVKDLKAQYEANRSPFREIGKYLFAICTFGLGGIWFASTTIVIREGHIGVREDARGNITLLPPGRHSNFPWESYPAPVQSLSTPVIHLGPYTLLTVTTGNIAITINQGIVTILEAGQHLLKQADHYFKSFLSIKQETEELTKIRVYTKDSVGLDVYADVQYEISNPKLAVEKVDDIKKSIKEIASIQLSSVIGSHTRQELFPATRKMDGLAANIEIEDEEVIEEESVGSEQDEHTSFEAEINQKIKDQLAALGINLIQVSIKNLDMIDTKLAHELGQGAVIQSQTTSRLLTAKRDAEILRISSEAEANAIRTKAEATAAAAKLLDKAPNARELEIINKHIQLVGAAKPGTQLHYGATGVPGFFQQAVRAQQPLDNHVEVDGELNTDRLSTEHNHTPT